VFENDVVEPDSCRTGSKRTGSTTRTKGNHGRTLFVKGRFKKQWVAVAMPSKDSKKGRGGEGSERLEEVEASIARLFGKGTVMAPDGSRAFHAAAKNAKKACLKGVSHITKVFTPVSKLLKSTLGDDETRMLRARSKGKQPAVKETRLYFVLVAGDNAAEGITGHVKNTMRRLGNVGRFNTKQAPMKNVQTMAAAAILRRAGLHTVLDALKQYRVACSSGSVKVAPQGAFSMDCVKTWLYKQ
jgi:hypothetical protein